MSSFSTSRYPNADCPACRKPIGPDASVRSCADCELSFHEACWTQRGGCTVAGCPNYRDDVSRVVVHPTAGRNGAKATRPVRRQRAPAAAAPPELPPSDSGAVAVRVFIAIVGVVVVITGIVGIEHWHRSRARRELIAVIRSGEANANPRRLVDSLDEFIRTHPGSDLTDSARERLDRARNELEQYDFAQADAFDHPTVPDFDVAERAYRSYLANHPDGSNRARAEARLRSISEGRDDSTFAYAVKLAKDDPLNVEAQQRAWDEYMQAYPAGRHVAAARAQLAQIPEKAEKVRFDRDVTQISEMIDAKRYTDALDRIDEVIHVIRADERRRVLDGLAKQAEGNLESSDAAACLGEPGSTREERDRQRDACRLFLLCYPHSSRRGAVTEQLAKLNEADPAESDSRPLTHEEMLDHFAARLVANIEATARRSLPATFDYRLLGSTVATVPISWSFENATHRDQLLGKSKQPFHGRVLIEVKAAVRRDASGPVRDDLKSDIDDELRSISTRLRLNVEFEIEEKSKSIAGLGVEFRDADGGGVIIGRTLPGSDASKLGLESGDRVVRVNATPVPSDTRKDAVEAMIANDAAGRVELTLMRGGRRFRVAVTKATYAVPQYRMRTKVEISPARPFGEPAAASDWTIIDPPS